MIPQSHTTAKLFENSAVDASAQVQSYSHNCMRVFGNKELADNWLWLHGLLQSKMDATVFPPVYANENQKRKLVPVVEWKQEA